MIVAREDALLILDVAGPPGWMAFTRNALPTPTTNHGTTESCGFAHSITLGQDFDNFPVICGNHVETSERRLPPQPHRFIEEHRHHHRHNHLHFIHVHAVHGWCGLILIVCHCLSLLVVVVVVVPLVDDSGDGGRRRRNLIEHLPEMRMRPH